VETVLFLRDEMANLAWAVEVLVTDDAGGLVDRFTGAPAGERLPPRAEGAPPRYFVDTVVPENWYPLAAEPLGGRGADGSVHRRTARGKGTGGGEGSSGLRFDVVEPE
jgi:hypothetical protein